MIKPAQLQLQLFCEENWRSCHLPIRGFLLQNIHFKRGLKCLQQVHRWKSIEIGQGGFDVILTEAGWLDWWERGVAPGWGGGAEDLQAAATSTPPSQPQLKTNPAPANTDVTVLTLSWRNGWQNIWSQIFWATKWLSSCYEVKWWRTDNRWQVEGGATQNLRRQLFIHLGWTLPEVWGSRYAKSGRSGRYICAIFLKLVLIFGLCMHALVLSSPVGSALVLSGPVLS